MRDDFEPAGGVTYIGPRSFVVGFVALCAIFLGAIYAAPRFAQSIETALPLSVPDDQARQTARLASGVPVPSASSAPAVLPAIIVPGRHAAPPRTVAPADAATPRAAATQKAPLVVLHGAPLVVMHTAPVVVIHKVPLIGMRKRPLAADRFAPVTIMRNAPVVVARNTPTVVTRHVPVSALLTQHTLAPRAKARGKSLPAASGNAASAGLLVPFKTSGALRSSPKLQPHAGGLSPGAAGDTMIVTKRS